MLRENVEQYYITITKEFHALYLREVIIVTTKCPLLNYLILIGKLHLWNCRKKQVIPNMEGFKFKVRIKYQVEKYISSKNNKLEAFYEKWPKDISPLQLSSCACKENCNLLLDTFSVLFFLVFLFVCLFVLFHSVL